MTSKSALQIWQDRLEFLNRERAIAVSADIKFQLDVQIVECEQKIRELSEKIVNDNSTESSSVSEREKPVQAKKNMAVNPPVDFVVITALEEERKAFLKQLPQSGVMQRNVKFTVTVTLKLKLSLYFSYQFSPMQKLQEG